MTLSRIASDIRGLVNSNRPLIVAVNGIDGSGKTHFAEKLAQALFDLSVTTHVLHVDDFHLPRAVRAACSLTPPECYYGSTFDWDLLCSVVLEPLREAGRASISYKARDLSSDECSVSREYVVSPGDVVILEGVFLLGPVLRPYFDCSVYLHISEEECLRRVVRRDGYLFGTENQITDRYHKKYLPGQRLYIEESNPLEAATWVVDNTDFTNPVIMKPSYSQGQPGFCLILVRRVLTTGVFSRKVVLVRGVRIFGW